MTQHGIFTTGLTSNEMAYTLEQFDAFTRSLQITSETLPGRGPGGFARGLGLPEHKIERIRFSGIIGKVAALVGSRQHGRVIGQANSACHLTKIRVFFDAIENTAFANVSIATCNERLHHL